MHKCVFTFDRLLLEICCNVQPNVGQRECILFVKKLISSYESFYNKINVSSGGKFWLIEKDFIRVLVAVGDQSEQDI